MIAALEAVENTHVSYKSFCPDEIVCALSLRSFYERKGSSDRIELRRQFLQKLGLSPELMGWAQQVHGAGIAFVDRAGYFPRVDGLATNIKGIYLTIAVADCLPIFLWDESKSAVSVLHAGWRGTVSGIAGEGVELLNHQFGIESSDLKALLGPCICPSCYEVGPEVAASFQASELQEGRADRFRLDLRSANRRQLTKAGLSPEKIFSDASCTRCRQDLFYSYRGEGQNAGRNIAVIGLKS